MSLLSAIAPSRRQPELLRGPVVLPLVAVHVREDGHLDVYVDHCLHQTSTPVTRDDLPSVLGAITCRLASPARVEVHEADGTVFTDIALPNSAGDSHSEAREPTRFPLSPGEIGGLGFTPDEEVAVAVVVGHQVAGTDGSARLRLPPALLADRPGIVVLIGSTSGTIAVSGARP